MVGFFDAIREAALVFLGFVSEVGREEGEVYFVENLSCFSEAGHSFFEERDFFFG